MSDEIVITIDVGGRIFSTRRTLLSTNTAYVKGVFKQEVDSINHQLDYYLVSSRAEKPETD